MGCSSQLVNLDWLSKPELHRDPCKAAKYKHNSSQGGEFYCCWATESLPPLPWRYFKQTSTPSAPNGESSEWKRLGAIPQELCQIHLVGTYSLYKKKKKKLSASPRSSYPFEEWKLKAWDPQRGRQLVIKGFRGRVHFQISTFYVLCLSLSYLALGHAWELYGEPLGSYDQLGH